MTTWYLRHSDGGLPVTVWDDLSCTVEGETYKSLQAMLNARNYRPNRAKRYFHRGSIYARPMNATTDTELLFDETVLSPEEPELGIDLAKRSSEVVKLMYSGFGQWIFSAGLDPEEVTQEVYRGILARNQGKCPWDKRKSSFGHYVHMVCNGVITNYSNRTKKRRGSEQVGLNTLDEDASGDARDANLEVEGGTVATEADALITNDLMAHVKELGNDLGAQIIPLLVEGYTHREIASKLKMPRKEVEKAITMLQEHTRSWLQ